MPCTLTGCVCQAPATPACRRTAHRLGPSMTSRSLRPLPTDRTACSEIRLLAVPRAKLGGSKSQPVLRNYTTDEGRPLEPTCRSRTQTTFRCCVLRDVVVNGEGKGPIRLGQVTSRKWTAREPPFSCRKELDDVKTTVVRRSWDRLRRYLLTDGAASGIQVG
jgi:hypothetical protein